VIPSGHAIACGDASTLPGVERILVTGAASWIGGRCVQTLERDHEVIAVDEFTPRLEFEAPFHRFSLDSLDFAHFLIRAQPTTVLHLQTLDRSAELGSARANEGVVLGGQALFGAIARTPAVRHVVVKSDTAVYSTGPRHASVLDETTRITGRATRYERNLRDIERFVTEVSGELPGVDFTVLRLASIVGSAVGNPLSRYLTLPTVPVMLGFDPRLQFIHEDDAAAALIYACHSPAPGVFNVAGDGILYLSRVLRLGRRIPQPLPSPQLRRARRLLASIGGPRLGQHTANLLRYGRFTQNVRMRTDLGFEPARSTREAVARMYMP